MHKCVFSSVKKYQLSYSCCGFGLVESIELSPSITMKEVLALSTSLPIITYQLPGDRIICYEKIESSWMVSRIWLLLSCQIRCHAPSPSPSPGYPLPLTDSLTCIDIPHKFNITWPLSQPTCMYMYYVYTYVLYNCDCTCISIPHKFNIAWL